MSNLNINKLAKYIVKHVSNHGKYYGSFPVSNGYVFTAPSITKDHIYFHLEKNNHTQRIYVKVNQTAFVGKSEYYVHHINSQFQKLKSLSKIYQKMILLLTIKLLKFYIPNYRKAFTL